MPKLTEALPQWLKRVVAGELRHSEDALVSLVRIISQPQDRPQIQLQSNFTLASWGKNVESVETILCPNGCNMGVTSTCNYCDREC